MTTMIWGICLHLSTRYQQIPNVMEPKLIASNLTSTAATGFASYFDEKPVVV